MAAPWLCSAIGLCDRGPDGNCRHCRRDMRHITDPTHMAATVTLDHLGGTIRCAPTYPWRTR